MTEKAAEGKKNRGITEKASYYMVENCLLPLP